MLDLILLDGRDGLLTVGELRPTWLRQGFLSLPHSLVLKNGGEAKKEHSKKLSTSLIHNSVHLYLPQPPYYASCRAKS
jgi:hypothetical protein